MTSDVPLDYAVFQLSPKRSRCELFVSYDGTTEKLASGLVKPFVTHLKVAEDQVALAVKSIKLEVERYKNAETWFTKGTLERFVRFVSTPEVLEMVNTYDAEMSQLEAARKIYSQGTGDHQPSASSGDGTGATATSDATKKELLRAIDVRLAAVKQDLTTACFCAFAAGFNPETISELQHFADRFGAHRLSEACSKFIDLSQRRPDLFDSNNPAWKSSSDRVLRASTSSDMSLDSPSDEQPKSSTCKVTFPLRRFSREPSPNPTDELEERENHKDKDQHKDKAPTTSSNDSTISTTESNPETQPSQKPQLTRRLSVQERISLFESKQKENSPSTATPSPVSAGVKPDLRRLSSDVASSSDKAVLRRWSGASDMSIDVSGERKEPDSNANTPTPTSASSTFPVFPPKSKDQVDVKGQEGDKHKDSKDSKLPVRAKFEAQLAVSSSGGSGSEEPASSDANSNTASFSGRSTENVGLKDQSLLESHSRAASTGRAGDFGLENQPIGIQTQFRSQPAKSEQIDFSDQATSEEKVKGPSGGGSRRQQDTVKNLGASVGHQDVAEDNEVTDQATLRLPIRPAQRRTVEVAPESAEPEVHAHPAILNKVGEGDCMPEPKWKSSRAEVEKVGRRDFETFEKQAESSSMQMENSGSSRSKIQGHFSEQAKRPRERKEEVGFGFGSSQLGFTGKIQPKTQEAISSTSLAPLDQVQRVRQSKGNHGLNDDLKMKANELEKLFAEHKLRVPADQSNSTRRTRPAEMSKQEGSSVNRKPVVEASPAQLTYMTMEAEHAPGFSSMEKLYSTPLMKTVDDQDYDVTPKHNIYSLTFSDDSRGKFYQIYMQKRDAKLRDDWSSRRAEKEAKMKTLHDSLEKSRAEMKVKLAGSADKRNSVHDTRRRAEKLRSFNVRSAMKREQPIDSFMNDEDDDQAEFLGKKMNETFLGDGSSRSAQSKKVIPNKNGASSASRNSTAPIPRSSGKPSNSAAGRRRLNSDNPLAQSVPNFSDLRKENTKPSSTGSKPVRPQGRNHARKKSSSEDLPISNEEKPRRSQSLRKSIANPIELNDSLISDDMDDTVFMPSKYDKEENEDYDKFSKDTESKAFARKGNGVGHIAGSVINRSKASVVVEAVRNGHDLDDVSFETEEMTGVAKEEDDDFETPIAGESADMDNGKRRLSQESDKSANSGYENSDAFRFSQAGPGSASEFPTSMPSLFRSLGSIQDSPGESPGSWNSRVQNPFSFPHEVSDIDACDSPLGSPASWNFQTLAQAEAEAARMRKKWGAAQKPMVGTDSSHTRKDLTKGLKRFLKFGRKNRASESLVDWISATTSEGDDDTEDGRDPVYRSSEDLRKSRMGFSHSHHSDDGFNESDLFNEQVHALQTSIPTPPSNYKLREEHLSGSSLKAPKSFFSLSNFRSKASDSKTR